MKARDIMTHPTRTVREDCTLEDALFDPVR